MRRLGDLLPEAAAALGIEEELRFARAMSAWERIVAEHVPAAAGASQLIALRGDQLLVSAASTAVASELRLRAVVLLGALAASPGGLRARELRAVVRQTGPGRGDGGPV
jgi:predicted nucleic acid-binding Zn ribbon protein